jgi:lipopolysaccharide transport system permease protein
MLELIRREVSVRYKGSILGGFWSFITPLLMMAVYTFVFSVVFKARWSVDPQSKSEFALILFAGLMVFNLFAESITRAPSLIQSSANYVKKVVFPLEVLPVVSLGASIFHLVINLLVWLLFYIGFIGYPPITAFFFIPAILPLIFFSLGVTWLLASLGVYLRDIVQVIGVVTSILLFMSPIFYPLSALPPNLQPWLLLSPITQVVECTRGALLWGTLPDARWYLAYLSGSLIVAWLGFAWFQKTRKGFADVI